MSEIKIIEGDNRISDARIAIIASSYNSFIVDRLVDGCIETLCNSGIDKQAITLARVPGAFEIPIAAKKFADTKKCHGIISLGAVIRGETSHFDYICNECASGLTTVALQTDIPVVFGVLTIDSVQQAEVRSGDGESNKGSEAAATIIEMISVLGKID